MNYVMLLHGSLMEIVMLDTALPGKNGLYKLILHMMLVNFIRTRQAVSVYPNLTITTCHSFEISYKYTYQCTECDYK